MRLRLSEFSYPLVGKVKKEEVNGPSIHHLQTNGRTEGRTDGRTDGWTDASIFSSVFRAGENEGKRNSPFLLRWLPLTGFSGRALIAKKPKFSVTKLRGS